MALDSEKDLTQFSEKAQQRIMDEAENYPIEIVERVYQLWWHWADFELFIIKPSLELISPPIIHKPERLHDSGDQHLALEPVYDIHDYGHKLITSKGVDMYAAGMSMFRLYNTIEKMIFLLIERLRSGGIAAGQEVQIAFGGHELAQRKCFECVINLPDDDNVIVVNFDPGKWGERYLLNVKRIADKGYGYPSETPRDRYRHPLGPAPGISRG